MKCNEFWDIYNQQGHTEELDDHLKKCRQCREEMSVERKINEYLDQDEEYKAPDILWNRVEENLDGKSTGKVKNLNSFTKLKYILAAAAVLIIAVLGVRVYDNIMFNLKDAAELAMEDIEKAEEKYISSINKYSQIVKDKTDIKDNPIYLLYMEKIDRLDEIIDECKEALVQNEGNVNVRKYLLLAYQEKVNTLEAVSKLT